MKLPPKQESITAKSFHPSGAFVEFSIEDVESSIPERFEKIVRMYPDRLAVKTDDRASTYNQLNRAANRLTHAIWEQCDDANDPVAILLNNTGDAITAILSVLKAGKIYLPLDLTLPSSRLRYLIDDSRTRLLITDMQSAATVQQLSVGTAIPTLIIDDFLDGSQPAKNPKLPITPDRVAALLYTSGSTGMPKGVVHSHRTLLHLVMRYSKGCRVSITDRIALLRTLTVIGGTSHTLGALLNGASLFPFDLKRNGILNLITWLRAQEVTMCSFGPKLIRSIGEIIGTAEPLSRVRRVTLSGEPVYKADIDLCRRLFSADCVLVNSLGATEAPVSMQYSIDPHEEMTGNLVPIGYPTEDFKVILRGENGENVGAGAVGEIVLQSRYLAVGYWGNAKLTQAKFAPASDNREERTYLTGDLGRYLPDGTLLHLGRKDLMVKIRGYRVELEEVERRLMEHPGVKDAGVTAWDRNQGEKYLAAYIVPRHPIRPTIDRLQSFIREMLPDYMVPSTFMFAESLPVTNGKLDRKALPEPDDRRPELSTAYASPTNEIETALVSIWENILDVRPIGINDNFFDLGGHSLSATRVVSRIFKRYQFEIPLQSLFQSPTIAEMAAVITEHQGKLLDESRLSAILDELASMSEAEAERLVSENNSTVSKKIVSPS
jgi:amino acid adenylation domain-containing protein